MRVIRHASELNAADRPVSAAIGVFDGVHLGHQAVLRHMTEDAASRDGLPLAITFDRHPDTVIAPRRAPRLIQSIPRKLEALAACGAEVIWLIAFDETLRRLPAKDFVAGLARDFPTLRSLSVGRGFTFGHRRGGDVALLERLGHELGFGVHGIEPFLVDGEPVSSTGIRRAIKEGDLVRVQRWLGREYAVAGQVTRGDGRGRELGVPTANLEIAGLVLPPPGVYAARARLNWVWVQAVLNLGRRPTVASSSAPLTLEVHLIDQQVDLYGSELEVRFLQRLRDEQRFDSLDALRDQLHRDIAVARATA